MIFDKLGLPKETGASDLQDSSRLAGIMETFGYRPNGSIPLEKYVIVENDKTVYCRHPLERRYNFSRDQTLCLVAGLASQGKYDLVNLDYVDGKDIFSPSHRGHIARCQGRKATFLQDAWLWLNVVYAANFKILEEPNKILCMLMLADKKFLKYYLRTNKQWRQAILNYWAENDGAWRGERELALHMIAVLEAYE
jgi:hypothetical protein